MSESLYTECQFCGDRLYGPLTLPERQQMADHPARFIRWCRACAAEHRAVFDTFEVQP